MSDQPVKVLLVEDTAGDARLIGETLSEVGGAQFELACADRLATGLARLSGEHIDVVLLDLGLPDSQGPDTFSRAHAHAPHIPIIVLTALEDEAVAVQMVHRGAQDYLVKGQVDGNLLMRAIRYAIERKRAEEGIHELNRELEQRVRERTAELAEANLTLGAEVAERRRAEELVARHAAELARANAELTATNKDLEAFTYSVSHDLRAPLRQMAGFSKVLLEDFGPRLEPEAQRHLRRIQEASQHMGRLVDDLLNLAGVGRQEVCAEITGLNAVVEDVLADLEAETHGRQIDWQIGSLPFVECDPRLMKLVFTNLLSNALKFTRPRERAVIEVGQATADSQPVIFVRDNGVGFNMKYAGKLFGAFRRLHHQEDFEGTGVGLATVQRIVHKHGGRVWAEAEMDRGATFYFTVGVPRDAAPEDHAREADTPCTKAR